MDPAGRPHRSRSISPKKLEIARQIAVALEAAPSGIFIATSSRRYQIAVMGWSSARLRAGEGVGRRPSLTSQGRELTATDIGGGHPGHPGVHEP